MSGPQVSPFGAQLRYWRAARCLSQLELAARASSTTRHISFLENGRSRPSEKMVHRLAAALEVPVRERNALLQAAGFAGTYAHRQTSDADLLPFMRAVRFTLQAHAPFPAMVVNRWTDVLEANRPAQRFFQQIAPEGVCNLFDFLFDREHGARDRFENWNDVAWGALRRLRSELALFPNDERLTAMVQRAERELSGVELLGEGSQVDYVKCPNVRVGDRTISLIGMVARFGSAQEATLDDIRLETAYPRDAVSEEYFRELAREADASAPPRLYSAASAGVGAPGAGVGAPSAGVGMLWRSAV